MEVFHFLSLFYHLPAFVSSMKHKSIKTKDISTGECKKKTINGQFKRK